MRLPTIPGSQSFHALLRPWGRSNDASSDSFRHLFDLVVYWSGLRSDTLHHDYSAAEWNCRPAISTADIDGCGGSPPVQVVRELRILSRGIDIISRWSHQRLPDFG